MSYFDLTFIVSTLKKIILMDKILNILGLKKSMKINLNIGRKKFIDLMEMKIKPKRLIFFDIFDSNQKEFYNKYSPSHAVVTFRNVHNWMGSSTETSSFELFFKALKPGGILGVVEHRAPEGTDKATMKKSGYMTQDYVIELARAAGLFSRHRLR